jgi:hypothetical protein
MFLLGVLCFSIEGHVFVGCVMFFHGRPCLCWVCYVFPRKAMFLLGVLCFSMEGHVLVGCAHLINKI